MRSRRKVVIIGLELGDGNLLHRWAQAGQLTTFNVLIGGGCWGTLATTASDLHISAWPSLYTGASPGEHGVYFTYQPSPNLQGYQRFATGLYGRATFWSVASAAGRSCAVFDAPYTHREAGYSGVQIFDWGTWAHYLRPSSTPAALLPRLEKKCGAYPLGLEAHDFGFSALDPEEARRRIIKGIDAKVAASRWLISEADWELFFIVFGETHIAGHYCWSPAAARGEAADGTMLDVYRAIDRGVASIRAAAGEDATVIVVSGDGIGPNHAGWHLLPDILARLGHLASADAGNREAPSAPRKGFDVVRILRDLIPGDTRKRLARRLPVALRDRLGQRVDMAYIDWSRTRAYCLPTDLEGYVRVNLRGREPRGIVEPGAEYGAVIEDIVSALGELRDPRTERAIVREVVRTDQAFPGERRPHLPDLIVKWEASAPIEGATSPRIGVINKSSPDPRPGTHTAPGFVLAHGPGIAAGTTLNTGHIYDLAPTVLALLDVDRPAHMRGRDWRELMGG